MMANPAKERLRLSKFLPVEVVLLGYRVTRCSPYSPTNRHEDIVLAVPRNIEAKPTSYILARVSFTALVLDQMIYAALFKRGYIMIWGPKSRAVKVGEGIFTCPQCRYRAKYIRRKERYYFMVLFVPIYPLRSVVDYIECTHCKKHFHTTKDLL